jgi:hypothetical protein
MKKVKIEIVTEHAAFGDDDRSKITETAYILRRLADQLEEGLMPQFVRDTNGNKCGTVKYVRK